MNRQAWATTFLRKCELELGVPDKVCGIPTNILTVVTWIDSEGSLARGNPLDTELWWAGCTDYNSAGVKNYASVTDGFAASKATLFNGNYALLIRCLKAGNDATNNISAIYHSVWGSKPTLTLLNNVRRNYQAFALVHVSGSGSITFPSGTFPKKVVKGDEMVASDPRSGGIWAVKKDGAVFAYTGAPYLGGLNNHPQWNTSSLGTVAGITPWKGDGTDQHGNGYAILVETTTAFDLYRFPGDGSLAK